MAHEVAKLENDVPLLGTAGEVVSISDVHAHFATSDLANSAAKFACVHCRVAVSAVLPELSKPERKRSPSPHFRAKEPHTALCRRSARVLGRIGPTANTMAARPLQAEAPTIWNDPPAVKADGVSFFATLPGEAQSPASPGAKVTTIGLGSSEAHSHRVERFARSSVTFSRWQWQHTALAAPWNPGGTYESAFTFLNEGKIQGSPTATQIYVGEIEAVHEVKSGFVLELTDKHQDGSELRVWLQRAMAEGSRASKDLWGKLPKGEIAPGMLVFALGEFTRQRTARTRPPFYSLAVAEGHLVWIVTGREVERLLG